MRLRAALTNKGSNSTQEKIVIELQVRMESVPVC